MVRLPTANPVIASCLCVTDFFTGLCVSFLAAAMSAELSFRPIDFLWFFFSCVESDDGWMGDYPFRYLIACTNCLFIDLSAGGKCIIHVLVQ